MLPTQKNRAYPPQQVMFTPWLQLKQVFKRSWRLFAGIVFTPEYLLSFLFTTNTQYQSVTVLLKHCCCLS